METRSRGRTYNARCGRLSPLTLERVQRLAPRHAIPDGPLAPGVAFGRCAPVVLEICCGHGAAALAYAQAHPGHDLLAVDVHTPGLARMLAEADRRGLQTCGSTAVTLPRSLRRGSRQRPWPRSTSSSPTRGRRRGTAGGTAELAAHRRLRGQGRGGWAEGNRVAR